MDETEFRLLAEKTLEDIETSLDHCNAGCDCERKEGLLEIECTDGTQIVINKHSVAQEIWLAARSGGFHFRYNGERWQDTRNGTELFEKISDLLSAANGRPVKIKKI